MNKYSFPVLCLFLLLSLNVSGQGGKSPSLPWGISAITLGKPVSTPPTIDTPLSKWSSSPVMDRFFKAGGETGKSTPSQSRIAWDNNALYILFICQEPNLAYPAHHRDLKLQDNIENAYLIDTYFPDRVDMFYRPDWQENVYYQFSTTLQGDFGGVVRGDLTKVSNLEAGGVVQKDKTSRPITQGYEVTVRKETGAWKALFRIPWQVLGGKPTEPFGIGLNRTRWRDSERLSPVALDFDDKPALDLFMETIFGKSPAARVSKAMLVRLPSGVLRWEWPAQLVYPSVAEKKAIWEMQQSLKQPTTESNLASRIGLTQRWIDLLLLEGFNFRKEAGTPMAESLLPHLFRRNINSMLRKGQVNAACDSLDAYLSKLNMASRNWYADESAGNIRADQWHSFRVQAIEPQGNQVVLRGEIENKGGYALAISFPNEGGIRMVGGKGGFFAPTGLENLSAEKISKGYMVKSKQYTVQIREGEGYTVSVQKEGQSVFNLRTNNLRFRFSPEGKIAAVDFSHALRKDEVLYGFGERYDAANLNGKALTLWGMDDYLGMIVCLRNQTYKPVPFFHTTAGYSLFFNTSYRMRVDLGQTQSDQYRITMHGPIFDLFVYAEEPAKAIEQYTNLTGKPVLPPRWAFEPWMGGTHLRWQAKGDPGTEVIRVATEFAKLDIPHSATYAEGSACDDPKVHTALAPLGIRVFSWMNSSIALNQQQKLLADVPTDQLPALRYPGGKAFISKHREYVDFSHPKAEEVVRGFWKRRLDLGIAGMIDFGDEVPETTVFHDGRTGSEMHNFYAYDYHRLFAQAFSERRADDYILFGRAGSAGSQRWMGQFAGDHRANFTGLRAAIYGALNLGSCGFSIWGSDTGGFFGLPSPQLYNRWVQFSCFTPLMRFHGTEPREPWEYGEEAVRNYRQYAWVRESLLDYLYSSAVVSHQTGLPMMRSMAIAFPKQARLANQGEQYLLGNDLLVAPAHTDEAKVTLAFQPGNG